MKNEKELQKKYFYAQMLKQQAGTFIEEKNIIDARINEVNMTKEAIKKIGGAKKGELMWSPMGSGAFMISSISDTENILVSAGAGVLVKTTKAHADEILDERLKDLQEADVQITAELEKFAQQIGTLEQEMQEMVETEKHEKEMKKPHKHTDKKVEGTGG